MTGHIGKVVISYRLIGVVNKARHDRGWLERPDGLKGLQFFGATERSSKKFLLLCLTIRLLPTFPQVLLKSNEKEVITLFTLRKSVQEILSLIFKINFRFSLLISKVMSQISESERLVTLQL